MFAANMLKTSVWLVFGFVICFYVCILLLVNCVDHLPVQCIYFMTYFRRLCFATMFGGVWHDNITNDHLIYGRSSLAVHLSLLFTSMIRHCYVPNDFCNSIIIPLLKSKHGDATNLDMYPGITLLLSSVIKSLWECFITVVWRVFKYWSATVWF